MINRRKSLQMLASGFGAALFPGISRAAFNNPKYNLAGAPKRVIFFLQNQGFDPRTCIPPSLKKSGSLAGVKLPGPIQALEPFRENMHIICGLHGRHTSPSHSAFFGALGGYRGGDGVAPSRSTIDYELSKILPQTLLPHLSIGMDSMENMTAKPTVANLSARGAGKPIFMHSNPNHLYQMLYGGISKGDIRNHHEAKSNMLDSLERITTAKGQSLPLSEKQRYEEFTHGFQDMNILRERLNNASDHLQKFAPKVDSAYSTPEFETDWHDRLLDLGISALKSGITNVLTIGSGRGEIFGAWKGLGIEKQGHNLGHMVQKDNPIWDKIRKYNCQMLVKLMEELDRVPEGSGTMMDNTLIVYTSNNADKQHTKGENWPVILLGNCGGTFKTGHFTQLQGDRPINALYTTILNASGIEVERFNMSEKMAAKYDSTTGPLREILA